MNQKNGRQRILNLLSSRYFKFSSVLLSILLILFGFQNCAKQFEIRQESLNANMENKVEEFDTLDSMEEPENADGNRLMSKSMSENNMSAFQDSANELPEFRIGYVSRTSYAKDYEICPIRIIKPLGARVSVSPSLPRGLGLTDYGTVVLLRGTPIEEKRLTTYTVSSTLNHETTTLTFNLEVQARSPRATIREMQPEDRILNISSTLMGSILHEDYHLRHLRCWGSLPSIVIVNPPSQLPTGVTLDRRSGLPNGNSLQLLQKTKFDVYAGFSQGGPLTHTKSFYLTVNNQSGISTNNVNSPVIMESMSNILFDKSGNLYILDPKKGVIWKMDRSGNYSIFADSSSSTLQGPNNTSYLNSIGLAAFDSFGNLIVTSGEKNILKFDSSGRFYLLAGGHSTNRLYVYPQYPPTTSVFGFGRITGLVTDSVGNVFLTDSSDHVVYKIDSTRHVLIYAGRWGGFEQRVPPNPNAEIIYPQLLSIDKNDKLSFYSESGYRNIISSGVLSPVIRRPQILDSNGTVLAHALTNKVYDSENNFYEVWENRIIKFGQNQNVIKQIDLSALYESLFDERDRSTPPRIVLAISPSGKLYCLFVTRKKYNLLSVNEYDQAEVVLSFNRNL